MRQATSRIIPKLVERIWGCEDLDGWARAAQPFAGKPIGEAWLTDVDCEVETGGTLGAAMARGQAGRTAPPLLAKLLFTSAPLSVQVHPTDAAALASGTLPSGKDEAWHVLEAATGALVWIGFVRPVTADRLRAAAENGAVLSLMRQHAALAGDPQAQALR
jgi:mannose-6-phosphate isomerase